MAGKGGRIEGAGRKKGIPNKSTTMAREAIAKFVNKNTGRLEGWLDRVAEDDPKGAIECVSKIMEYHMPKINRIEHTGEEGGAIDHSVKVTFEAPSKDD
jgi:hypothetical protein